MSLEHGIAVPCVSLVQPATAAGVRAIRRSISVFAEANGAHGAGLAAIELAVAEFPRLLTEGAEKMMNRLHTAPPAAEQ